MPQSVPVPRESFSQAKAELNRLYRKLYFSLPKKDAARLDKAQ